TRDFAFDRRLGGEPNSGELHATARRSTFRRDRSNSSEPENLFGRQAAAKDVLDVYRYI
ncbi:hypothetical protein BaRGS_00020274, partial [Batillaria attramentaria]